MRRSCCRVLPRLLSLPLAIAAAYTTRLLPLSCAAHLLLALLPAQPTNGPGDPPPLPHCMRFCSLHGHRLPALLIAPVDGGEADHVWRGPIERVHPAGGAGVAARGTISPIQHRRSSTLTPPQAPPHNSRPTACTARAPCYGLAPPPTPRCVRVGALLAIAPPPQHRPLSGDRAGRRAGCDFNHAGERHLGLARNLNPTMALALKTPTHLDTGTQTVTHLDTGTQIPSHLDTGA